MGEVAVLKPRAQQSLSGVCSLGLSNTVISCENSASGQSDTEMKIELLEVGGSWVLGQKAITDAINSINSGFSCSSPELCEEGVSGVYFLKDENDNRVAVFKPQDEEPFAENNPKNAQLHEEGYINKKGLHVGEAAIREVAAYLLDKGSFSEVPPTAMAKLGEFQPKMKTKVGSMQLYRNYDSTTEDVGSSQFPVREVHKIGILDCRIMNMDRHTGNMLVQKNNNQSFKLIPIDHGFSMPCTLDEAWFDWLHWNQAKVPFDDETKIYVHNIDIESDLELLRSLGLNENAVKVVRLSSTLLKKGVMAGLTLYDIACMICRPTENNLPSLLEEIVLLAKLKLSQASNPSPVSSPTSSCSNLAIASSSDELRLLNGWFKDEDELNAAVEEINSGDNGYMNSEFFAKFDEIVDNVISEYKTKQS